MVASSWLCKKPPINGQAKWTLFFSFIVIGLCFYIVLNYISPLHIEKPSTPHCEVFKKAKHQSHNTFLRNGVSHEVQTSGISTFDFEQLSLANVNISYSYKHKWVGFPDLQTVDCHSALKYPTLNRIYPHKVKRILPADFLYHAKDCKTFVTKYGYLRHPLVSQEERDFPIGFVILFHKDLDQVNFLLRAIYRPHNVYCLSVDTKSSIEFLEATRALAHCLPNVFVASKLENIVYAGISRLMADLHCFQDLLQHPVKWKYIINGPGQAFPLRTNLEMVQILKLRNGTNDIESKTGTERKEERFIYKWEYITNDTSGEISLKQTSQGHTPPPQGLEVVKCSAYGAFTRQFVEFMLTNRVAKDLLDWVQPVFSPDELYWATLNYNSIVPAPGGFKGVPAWNPWLTSFSVWTFGNYFPCLGHTVRDVCIFSPADLPLLTTRHELFANKFYISYQPAALHCLDQLIYNTTFSRKTRELSHYRNLGLPVSGFNRT